MEASNIMIKEKHITMRKHASQNGVMSDFDNEVDFEEDEAFDVAAEPDVEVVPDHSAKEPPPAEEPPPVHKLVDDSEASSSGVKRAHGSTGDSPTYKKKGKFPQIGFKICISSATGKQIYLVHSNFFFFKSDWNFNLINITLHIRYMK